MMSMYFISDLLNERLLLLLVIQRGFESLPSRPRRKRMGAGRVPLNYAEVRPPAIASV